MRHQSCPDQGWELASALPHASLRPGVHGYRGFRLALDRPRRRLELPVGGVTLLFGFDHRITLTDATSPTARPRSFTSLVSGLHTRATIGEHNGTLHGLEVLMAPWAAYRLFGGAMPELADTAADPAALLGRRFDALSAELTATADWADRFARLDNALGRWSAAGPAPAPQVVWAWRELVRTSGALPIRQLAEQTNWGWRQLDKRFREQTGLTPKAVARALRLRHCLRLLAAGAAPAQAAIGCGFYDQAHLNREFRAMTGLTPGRFLALHTPLPPGPPNGSRLAGQISSVMLPQLAYQSAKLSNTSMVRGCQSPH